jgi:hypothetical protein
LKASGYNHLLKDKSAYPADAIKDFKNFYGLGNDSKLDHSVRLKILEQKYGLDR